MTGATREEPNGWAQFGELVGRSAALRTLFAEGARLAAGAGTILISGEPGTGKNSLARALHDASPVRSGAFVTFDCGAPAAGASGDELFGRAEGASAGRPGALELARGGTLLLDEVADLPLPVQQRLREALAAGSFTRVAGDQALRLDVRVLSVSKRKLSAEVERGKFAPELYAQLAQAELLLPALRERREDIPVLAQVLLERLDERGGLALSAEALELLALHDWPGNVRELRNVLERFLYALRAGSPRARHLGALLLAGELPAIETRPGTVAEPSAFEPGLSYREQRARFEAAFERRYVAWLLERHDGNISAAARAAEMDRKYLSKLARRHGLKSTG